jgi:flagellar basal body-associated protein FliL
MADEDDIQQQEGADDTEQQEDSKTVKSDKPVSSGGMLPWIIMAVVVVLCAGAGLGLGRLFAGFRKPQAAEPTQEDEPAQAEHLKADNPNLTGEDSQKTWYFELDPVVANLDVPGITRYVRAQITHSDKLAYHLSCEPDTGRYQR